MLRTDKKKKEPIDKTVTDNWDTLFKLLFACRRNAIELITEADLLYKNKHYARAYFLIYSANEEITKGQIVADFITGIVSLEEFKKAFYDHGIKTGYSKAKIVIDTGFFKELRKSKGKKVLVQDNTLVYDNADAKEMMNVRNSAMYVSYKDKFVPVTPKDSFKAKVVRETIKNVKHRLAFIYEAEEFNSRIGTKALIK